jgi:hypothetical protein
LVLLIHLGRGSCGIMLRGDSVSVLEWTSHARTGFRSTRAQGAAMLLVCLCARYDIVLNAPGIHISSEVNLVCDRLSRGKSPPPGSCGESPILWGDSSGLWSRLLAVVNPLLEDDSENSFVDRWTHANELATLARDRSVAL